MFASFKKLLIVLASLIIISCTNANKTEENLKKLDKICFLGCSEFDKLKKSIMDKKSGKKSSY